MTLRELPYSLTREPLHVDGFFGDDLSPLDRRARDVLDARAGLQDVASRVLEGLTRGGARSATDERGRRDLRAADAARLTDFGHTGATPDDAEAVRSAARHVMEAARRHREAHELATTTARTALVGHVRDHDDLVWSLRSLGTGVERSRLRLLEKAASPDARWRKHELVFTRVLVRSAMKTSPISRFALVAVHAPEGHGVTLRPSRFSFNNAALFELYEAVALSDEGIDAFSWEPRPWTSVVDGHVVAYTEEWNSATASVYRARDSAVRLPVTPTLLALVTPGAPWTTTRVQHEFGLPPERAAALVRKLVVTGVFRPSALPSDRADLATALAEDLEATTRQRDPADPLATLAGELRRASVLLEAANADPGAADLRAVEDHVADLRRRWGARGDRSPATLVYEDAVTLGTDHDPLSRRHADDLLDVLRLWPLFDVNVRIQLTFAVGAGRWDGRSAVDPGFFASISRTTDAYRDFWTSPWRRVPSDVPDVRQLDDLRDGFVEHLRSLAADGSPRDEVDLDRDAVRSLLGRLPASTSGLDASYTVFGTDDGPDLVVNKLYPGHLAFLGRFLRHTTAAHRDRTLFDDFYADGDAGVADVYETNGFNATARPEPFLSTRVVSPYSRDRAADEEYEKVVDVSTATLDIHGTRPVLVADDGSRHRPVVTSNLLRSFLPAYTAMTSNLFGAINHLTDLALVLLPSPDLDQLGAVTATPRVRLGSVVLERRHWFVRAEELRRAWQPRLDHADQHVELVRILLDLDLPLRFYYRVRDERHAGTPLTSISTQFAKPQFVDVRNPLLVSALRNALHGATWVVIVEPLPDRPHAAERVREFRVLPEEHDA